MADGEGAVPSGFGGALSQMKMNIVEFAICAGFWVVVFIGSSFISLESILGEPAHTARCGRAR